MKAEIYKKKKKLGSFFR